MPMEMDKRNNYPSDFISPEQKASEGYALKWAQAIDKVGIEGADNGFFPGMISIGNGNQISKFAMRRAYARGEQPIDKYKPILRVPSKERKDANAVSYRALNWEILDIASKYVNVLIGKLIKQNNDIGVNAVDKKAQDARRAKRMELQEYVLNNQFLDDISQKTGISFDTPIQEDVVEMPKNMGEVNMFMDMFYKEEYCLIIQDLIKLMNEYDNYQDILVEVARDLVETGFGVTKVYRVQNKIMRRRCVPERMVMSSTQKTLCDDVKFVGEYWDLTIGQLKEIAGGQFSEDQYRKIAETAARQDFSGIDINDFQKKNFCYPWDNTKITVLDAVWFSPDWETYQIGVNQFGNVAVTQKEYSWWADLAKKGVTEDAFNKVNKSQVVRYSLDNQYQCMWIKGTEFVFNYGKSKDMLKNQSNLGKTIGPFTIYKMKKCVIDSIMPTLDNIQIQWLQYQHHSAKSVPAGPAIEFTALQDISLGGAGGKLLTPKEALQIYWDTGTLLWRRRDAQGNLSNFKPIEQMAGGISNAMEKHFSYMIQDINLLRDQIGLNELTDASTPNSEMGKAVATMAAGATDDALRGLFFGFDQINLGTHQRTVMHISGMAATGLAPEYVEALGLQPMAVQALLSDLTYHELGVYLMRQPTQEIRAWLNEYCKVGIQNGTLYEEEAMEIQMETNIWRAIRLLKMYRKQKNDLKQQQMMQQYKAEEEKNINSANATAQAQQQNLMYELQTKEALLDKEIQGKLMIQKQASSDEAFLLQIKAKLDRDQALDLEEQQRLTELAKIDKMGQIQLAVARAKGNETKVSKK